MLHRWTPATGAHTQHDALHIAGTRRIGVVPGGEVLLLTAYDRIILVAADAKFTHLATLIPLLTGGWMARSAAGAFEGSDDAPRHLVTRAEGPRDALLLDGALGWDGALVPGLYRRALAGELVPAPIP